MNSTTQHAKMILSRPNIWNKQQSANPALNIPQRMEAVATDQIYADVPAVDNGCTSAQFFCGWETMVCAVYPLKTDKSFVNTLEDVIRKRGAMTKLISDRAQVEISK